MVAPSSRSKASAARLKMARATSISTSVNPPSAPLRGAGEQGTTARSSADMNCSTFGDFDNCTIGVARQDDDGRFGKARGIEDYPVGTAVDGRIRALFP